MIYHSELQPLYKFVSNLTFSETYTRSLTEDDSLIDFTVSSVCNNFIINKFELKLIELTNEILDSTDDLSKESILELIISLENLKADLFEGSKYKKQINTIKGEEPKNDDAITSGMLYIGNISQIINKPQEFQVQIHNSISTLNQELKQIILADNFIPVEKLIWNVKSKVLAHLLIELDRKKWIKLPKASRGAVGISTSKVADLAYNIFEYGKSKSTLRNALEKDSFDIEGLNIPFVEEIV